MQYLKTKLDNNRQDESNDKLSYKTDKDFQYKLEQDDPEESDNAFKSIYKNLMNYTKPAQSKIKRRKSLPVVRPEPIAFPVYEPKRVDKPKQYIPRPVKSRPKRASSDLFKSY